jgi:hypothetical protein
LEHLTYIRDLAPSFYYPFASFKENHGGLKFEDDCEAEATVRAPAVIQDTACCQQGTEKLLSRNYNPSNIVVQLKLKCYLLELNITTQNVGSVDLIFERT